MLGEKGRSGHTWEGEIVRERDGKKSAYITWGVFLSSWIFTTSLPG